MNNISASENYLPYSKCVNICEKGPTLHYYQIFILRHLSKRENYICDSLSNLGGSGSMLSQGNG